MVVFQDLPFDVVCLIIGYLPIRSILHLHQVSKHLQRITHERSIWSQAYHISSLVRPQGPFPWQTAKTLESILVRSARLTLNWPPNPDAAPVHTRARVINAGADVPMMLTSKLLCGRWLLVLSGLRQIVCYDLDRAENSTANEPFSIVYEPEAETAWIVSFEIAIPLANIDADRVPCLFLAVVVHQYAGLLLPKVHRRTLYKTDFAEGTFGTFLLLSQANTEFTDTRLIIGPRLLAMYEPAAIPQHAIFIDIDTYRCYKFPQQTITDAEIQLHQTVGESYCFKFQEIFTTSTHVLLFRRYGKRGVGYRSRDDGMYIEAYKVPSSQEHDRSDLPNAALQSVVKTLHLSHATVLTDKDPFTDIYPQGMKDKDRKFPDFTLLRDSTFNRFTGTTRINFASVSKEYLCVIVLRLDPGPYGSGSVTLEPSKNIIHIGKRRYPLPITIQPSFNGHTRGLGIYPVDPRRCVIALEIDDEANTQTSVTLDVPCFRELGSSPSYNILAYDMYRGRIVFSRPSGALVVDFL